MAIGSVWKADEKFVVQFNKVKPKDKRIIDKTFQEWNPSGSGFHRDGTEVLIFSNSLLDEEKVFNLVKNMPFPFTEEKRNGTSKRIRTSYTGKQGGLTGSTNNAKIGGRTCSKCGIKGHNSRTCKE